jgi:bacterial/archaeal transporter family-2 protein
MRYIALAVVLGIVAVIQAAINRQIALRWGLAPAAALNTGIATVVAAIFLGLAVTIGTASFVIQPSLRLADFRWYWVLPGVFGFLLVAGIPWAVHQVGALRVFVGLVAAQMVTSLALDHFAEGIPMTTTRGAGALLAIASVFLVSLR